MTTAVTSLSPDRDERLDRVFQALSDRTRRALIERLRISPAGVKELAAPFSMSLPAVGKHLRVLEDAGLVTREIRGRNHVISLAAEALADADGWLESYRTFWDGNLEALAAEFEGDGT